MSPRAKGAAVLVFTTLLPQVARAAENVGGALVGWVEDTRGAPIAGAVISLFGKGVGSSGLVTLSDSAGRFFLPVPAGSYTLRALGDGHEPAPARQVTVRSDRDSVFTVSLTPVSEAAAAAGTVPASTMEDPPTRVGELRWLVRHKRRSVLETRGSGAEAHEDDAEVEEPVTIAGSAEAGILNRRSSWLPDLDGRVEVMASPGVDASREDGVAASFSALRLEGRIADSGRWSLGGLVGESEGTTWRMAAEFILEPGGGHEIRAGTGYGTRFMRPVGGLDGHGVGAVFIQDRWEATDRITATLGTRFSHIGFLADHNHVDPVVSLEVRRDSHTRVRGTASARTLVPGGDLLNLSALSTAPAVAHAVMDPQLRPERTNRYELAVDQELGATSITALGFYEGVRDQLVNAYEGRSSERVLRISNTQGLAARGMGVKLSRRFGSSLHGTVTYTYGHSWRSQGASLGASLPLEGLHVGRASLEGDFHDVTARVETVIGWSDTRLMAFYRVNRLSPEVELGATRVSSRFDVQLSQGLPFLGSLTRADWEVLLAFRNLFYEASDGATLDEIAVAKPPKRMLGGISVRF